MSVMTWFVGGAPVASRRKDAIEIAVRDTMERKLKMVPDITVCWNSSDKRYGDYGQRYDARTANDEASALRLEMLRAAS